MLLSWALGAAGCAASQHKGSHALSVGDPVLRSNFGVVQPEDPPILVKLVQLAALGGGSVCLLVGKAAAHDERRLAGLDGDEQLPYFKFFVLHSV